jgi:hypothetical protein
VVAVARWSKLFDCSDACVAAAVILDRDCLYSLRGARQVQ